MNAKGRWLGWLAGLLSVFAPRKITPEICRRDRRTGTQRIGVRFTERLRNHFRTHWIKSSRSD